MTGKLPLNIDHLLRQRTIEGERVGYKAGWNSQSVRQNGSPEPVFESDEDRTWFLVRLPAHERALLVATPHDTPHDTPHVTQHVERLIALLTGEMNRSQLQEAMKLRDRSHFTSAYLEPAIKAGLIEMTIPDKPKSRNQRYRRTVAGEALAVRLKTRDAAK